MLLAYDAHLKSYARALRKNMTLAERRLRYRLNRKQLIKAQFYRQKALGPYIVDFYCPKAKLVIEVDGGQHYSGNGLAKDRERDGYFSDLGLRVLRFSAKEVLSRIDEVVLAVFKAMQ